MWKIQRSNSGYAFTLTGATTSWKSSKQIVIARSTMEFEFIALDKCSEGIEWLWNFLEGIPSSSNLVPAICIHYDNQSVIGRAQSNMYKYNDKSTHIRWTNNTIRQLLSTEVLSIEYVE